MSVTFAAEGGIVPALSVVKRLLAESPVKSVSVFYGHEGSHPGDEIADSLEQLLALKNTHLQRLSLGVVMEREPDEAELLSGRLDAAKVHALAGKLFDPKSVQQYFVCGSEALAQDVITALGELGVDRSRIHVEKSGAAAAAAVATEAAKVAAVPTRAGETQVSFVMDGRRRSFTMRTDEESILEAAARAGIELPFSCKAGVCSTCRTKLVSGKVELMQNHALEDWELEQGFILACQAHARTPAIELTYDEK